jgi:hypothetical protein
MKVTPTEEQSNNEGTNNTTTNPTTANQSTTTNISDQIATTNQQMKRNPRNERNTTKVEEIKQTKSSKTLNKPYAAKHKEKQTNNDNNSANAQERNHKKLKRNKDKPTKEIPPPTHLVEPIPNQISQQTDKRKRDNLTTNQMISNHQALRNRYIHTTTIRSTKTGMQIRTHTIW